MVHLGQLSWWVQFAMRTYTITDLVELAEAAGWQEEEGLRYVNLADIVPESAGGRMFEDHEAALELVEVSGTLNPHVHPNHATVALAAGLADTDEAEFWSDHAQNWVLLSDGELVVVPRGVKHGFRPDPSGRVFYLLVASSPPLGDEPGSTVYV